jgi:hypothetical protein
MGREAVSVWRLLAAEALPLGSGTTAATLTLVLEVGGALSGDIVSRDSPQVPASEEINSRPDRST